MAQCTGWKSRGLYRRIAIFPENLTVDKIFKDEASAVIGGGRPMQPEPSRASAVFGKRPRAVHPP